MEVDWSPTSAPGGSRHGSPFHQHGPAAGPSSSSPPSGGPSNSTSRKRRRSIQQPLMIDAGAGSHTDAAHSRDRTYDDNALPMKRLNRAGSAGRVDDDSASPHYYRALGGASSAMEADGSELGYAIGSAGGDGSDYGVDSPMHSLSLLSRSPSAEDTRQYALSRARQDVEEDVEMGMSGSVHADETLSSTTTTTSFVPRQLRKHGMRSIANAPAKPSPLAQQTDERASSNDSSPFHRSMERSMSSDSSQSSSSHAHRRQSSRSHKTTVAANTAMLRRQSYDAEATATNVPLRRASRTDRAVRTPSPRPQQDPRGNQDGHTASDAHGSSLQHSPGLSQSSFPGGKQMLRYTMGYRDDCEMCRNKVAGHYGHVVHRST